MVNVEFMDELPPPVGPWDSLHRREVQEFAEALQRNPGRWAPYPWPQSSDASRSMASRISRGKIAAFAENFQAISRNGVVYVRYEGDTEREHSE